MGASISGEAGAWAPRLGQTLRISGPQAPGRPGVNLGPPALALRQPPRTGSWRARR